MHYFSELFPQLDHQKRVIAKSVKRKKARSSESPQESRAPLKRKRLEEKVPKAYRLDQKSDSSDESEAQSQSDDENKSETKSDDDSGLDSDSVSVASEKLDNVQVSSLVSDMEKIKQDLIKRNEYDKLKEKFRQSDSDDE